MANLFKKAHEMTKQIKKDFPDVDYKFQFALCCKYLKNNKESEMVQLIGSEKQIAWATDIRNHNIKVLQNEINEIKARHYDYNLEISPKSAEMISKLEKAINDIMTTHPDSKFWIDHKGLAGVYIHKLYNK